ncbi:MAG: hypothetical protein PHF51_03160 [Candidatus ainarchaeum sp.]|nr:hypothetical protein [Candidatus ainarchaeum sp.]
MARKPAFAAAAAMLICVFSQLTLADAGPGPDPATLPYVVLNVTFNGQPVPDDTQVKVHCLVNGIESPVPSSSLECARGICGNSYWYKLSPCARSGNATAVFEFSHPSILGNRGVNTSALPIEGGKTYGYDVAISLDGSVSSRQTGVSENQPGLCPVSLAIPLLALLGFAWTRAK